MGFTITFTGPVTTVYNIEVAAGATLHIGGGSSNHSSGKFQGDTCPIKITKAQRTEWGTACATDHEPPEGWTAEIFSSGKAFANDTIPNGLSRGDAIFYYKEGVSEDDVPDGFIAVYRANNVIVIVPTSLETELHADDDDDDADSSLDGNDGDFDLPTSPSIISDGDDELLDTSGIEDNDDVSPF